jgi:chemotaxis signal transduction protein
MTKGNGDARLDNDNRSESLLFELTSGESGETQPGGMLVLVFDIGEEKYAIGVDYTEGVVDCPRITPLPSPPDGMIGVTSVRGKMTLVFELGPASAHRPVKRRLILLKGDAQLGLIADRIDGIVSLAPSARQQAKPREAAGRSLSDSSKEDWPVISSFMHGDVTVRVLDVEGLVEA